MKVYVLTKRFVNDVDVIGVFRGYNQALEAASDNYGQPIEPTRWMTGEAYNWVLLDNYDIDYTIDRVKLQ